MCAFECVKWFLARRWFRRQYKSKVERVAEQLERARRFLRTQVDPAAQRTRTR
jgi:hypothetical protein